MWAFALLGVLAIWPITLTLHLRRLALNARGKDPTAAWFGYMRSLHWTLLGAVVLWWAATDFVGLQRYTNGLSDFFGLGETVVGEVLAFLLVWLPILIVLVLCTVLSQPVYAGVRGLTWTRAELAKLGVLRLGVTYLPLLVIVGGQRRSFSEDNWLNSYLLCFAVATGVFLLSLRYLRAALDWKPEALTRGELRDRAFALAAKLGVKVRQIYVVPAGKMRMANAFASSGNTILLTDYLLTRLNRREVDAIVAHELGHLKHKHGHWRGAIMGLMAGGIIFWYSVASPARFLPIIDIGVALAWFSTFYFVSRRLEFTADGEAAKLTGDPEALITGLAKAHSLNLVPIQFGKWDEKVMTHPSVVRRAEAIAKSGGLPLELVPGILASSFAATGPPEHSEDGYPLPETIRCATKIFSTQRKRRAYWQNYLAVLFATAVVPAVVVSGIRILGWPMGGSLICFAAFLLGAVLSLVLANRLAFVGYGSIERELCQRTENEVGSPEELSGILVGLSPGEVPRVFETNYSWDMGYLFFSGDRLCYWGEESRFALPRDQIISVRVGPGTVGWMKAAAIYITWHDGEKATNETFSIRAAAVHSLLQMSKAAGPLFHRIESWRSGALEPEDPREKLAELAPPAFGEVTNVPVKPKLRPIVWQAVIVGFAAGFTSSLLGSPVDFASPIAHMTGLVGPDVAALWGWYSMLSAWLVLLFWLAPFLTYRNPPLCRRSDISRIAGQRT
jgi:STE24 endopeptidase